MKRGGVLNIVRHEIEVFSPYDKIPAFFEIDLTGLEIGKSIHMSYVQKPDYITPVIKNRDFTIATIAGALKGDTEEAATTAAAGRRRSSSSRRSWWQGRSGSRWRQSRSTGSWWQSRSSRRSRQSSSSGWQGGTRRQACWQEVRYLSPARGNVRRVFFQHRYSTVYSPVIPAQAAIHPSCRRSMTAVLGWMPACAGMTKTGAAVVDAVIAGNACPRMALGQSSMKLFVGLGNPGDKYSGNRHNIGFMAVERIARAHGFSAWRKKFNALVCDGDIGG